MKKYYYLSILSFFIISLGLFTTIDNVSAQFAGGNGTQSNPYQIETPEQFNQIRNYLNFYFILTDDIDLSSYSNWEPIGTNITPFNGYIFGRKYVVYNLNIDRLTENNVGLFGVTSSSSQIESLILIKIDIIGNDNVGGLVGNSNGRIYDNHIISGSVSGNNNVGGLIGNSDDEITRSSSSVKVSGTENVGGLIGNAESNNIYTKSFSSNSVTGTTNVGGLIGKTVESSGDDSYSTARVTGTENVGGLIGYNKGSDITNSYSTGTASGNSSIGGLVGYNNFSSSTFYYFPASITNSYSTTSVSGTENVGGLIGNNIVETVSSSYWNTETSSQSTSAGGEGKTTSELQTQSTYINWDFDDTWDYQNSGYPVLRFFFDGGYGSESNPYRISKPYQLYNVRYHLSSNYKLISDINLSEYSNWEPIGFEESYTTYPTISSFIKNFDGNGYKITDLNINRPTENYTGLFKAISYNAELKNVKLENVNIIGNNNVGGLVGTIGLVIINDGNLISNPSKISNSYISGIINGNYVVGGLVGYNYDGMIENSYSTASVIGNENVGGLVGGVGYYATNSLGGYTSELTEVHNFLASSILNSYSTGIVNGTKSVGGLVGWLLNGTIENSYSTGDISGNTNIGGLVGSSGGIEIILEELTLSATIENSYSTGTITSLLNAGGLVADASFTKISNSYSTSSVSSTGGVVGGLVGYNWNSKIENSYSTGTASGTSSIGGLVGLNNQSSVTNSYSTTSVSGTGLVGGLIGNNIVGTVSSSYWNTETSSQSTSAGGEGKTTSELQTQSTYIGWNFDDIWDFTSQPYPFINLNPRTLIKQEEIIDEPSNRNPVEPNITPLEPTPIKPSPIEPTPSPIEPTPSPIEPTPSPIEPTPSPIEPIPSLFPFAPIPFLIEPTQENNNLIYIIIGIVIIFCILILFIRRKSLFLQILKKKIDISYFNYINFISFF